MAGDYGVAGRFAQGRNKGMGEIHAAILAERRKRKKARKARFAFAMFLPQRPLRRRKKQDKMTEDVPKPARQAKPSL
ncbi:MAG: hypothetical protein LBH35_01360 [Treponema sp.]|nr:hypothetical protein [Treponema sp.]